MINESLSKVFGWPTGFLLHEGYQVKCSGTPDAQGNIQDRHLICTLDDHLPGAQAHAVGNAEFTDDLWVIEPTQSSINWTHPVCQICSKELSP